MILFLRKIIASVAVALGKQNQEYNGGNKSAHFGVDRNRLLEERGNFTGPVMQLELNHCLRKLGSSCITIKSMTLNCSKILRKVGRTRTSFNVFTS